LLRGGALALLGRRSDAARHYANAASAFDAAQMALFAAAAKRRHGEMIGGESGRAAIAEADAWMNAHGVTRPSRMTAMLAPGVPLSS
jgi:hypothetical protein